MDSAMSSAMQSWFAIYIPGYWLACGLNSIGILVSGLETCLHFDVQKGLLNILPSRRIPNTSTYLYFNLERAVTGSKDNVSACA